MKKSIRQIPKYLFGNWIKKQPNVAQGWLQSRTFPVVNSRILREWERTGKKPLPESSKDRIERLKKEATQKTWLTKAANIAHNVGNIATTAGLIGSAVMAPVATLGALAGGIAGGKLADVVTRRLTHSEDNPEGKDFAQWFNNKFGLRDESMIGHIFNPGMLVGGAVGARMAPTVAGWYKPISSAPEAFVHPAEAASTGGYVSPSIRRIDITAQEPFAESAKLSRGQFEYLFNLGKIKKESDLYKYMPLELARRIFKMASKVKKGLGRFSSSNLKDKKDLDYFNAVLERSTSGLKGTRGTSNVINKVVADEKALTPEGKLEAIRNRIANEDGETYWDLIKKSAKETGINWADDTKENPNTVLAGMDTELKLTPVGGHSEPFIQRYYDNVIKHIIGKGGFLEKILKSGDLRINPKTELWEGKYADGVFRPVRNPEEYIKVRYAREKGLDLELPISDGTNDGYLMHGTKVKGTKDVPLNYITQPSVYPGKNGIWTIRHDLLGAEADAISGYKDQGYSIPFYRSLNLEVKPPFKNGTSYNLMNKLAEEYAGKVMRPLNVKDANFPKGRVNEYIFSPTAPNPKSMWNTLDFEPGAGPMAYIPINVTGNNYA